MRKLALGLGLTVAAAFPGVAQAEVSFYCYVSIQLRGQPEEIVAYTDIMTASGDIDGDKLDRAWGDFFGPKRYQYIPPSRSSYGPNCTSYAPQDIEQALEKLRAEHPGAKKMSWPNPPVPLRSATPQPSSANGSLIIEKAPQFATPAAEMAALRLKAQRDYAAKAARAAAEALKHDAEIKAKIAARLEEMRRRCGGPEATACAQ